MNMPAIDGERGPDTRGTPIGELGHLSRTAQVEHDRDRIFKDGDAALIKCPELSRLCFASYNQIRESLSSAPANDGKGRVTVCPSFIWNDGVESDASSGAREIVRPSRGREELGYNLVHQAGAIFLSNPKNPESEVILRRDTDPTLLAYMQNELGILGAYMLVGGLRELRENLAKTGRIVYAPDNYGSQFDGLTLNSGASFDLVNNKAALDRLVSNQFMPSQEFIPNMLDPTFVPSPELFERIRGDGPFVVIKLCNTEHGGTGVFIAHDPESFMRCISKVRGDATQYPELSKNLILQQGITGENHSFTLYIDPNDRTKIFVVAVTDQICDQKGKYIGSKNHPVTAETVRQVGPAMVDLVNNMAKHCPDAAGFVMCDYFTKNNGQVIVIDPGLRPSGNTPGAMLRALVEQETGKTPYITSRISPPPRLGVPMSYQEVVRKLGDLATRDNIINNMAGVVPHGWNHLAPSKPGGNGGSWGYMMVVSPTESDSGEIIKEVHERLAHKTN